MQFSENWLRQWVNPAVDTNQLAEALTMLGLEVDTVMPAGLDFTGVVVGEVVLREPHPNADRLSYCRVNIGEKDLIEVVCGGTNVRTGIKVAFIKVGGVLPGDFKIKKAKLRGVESRGMICSTKELGLGEGIAGEIIELPEDAPVGMDFREYIALDDNMIDVELTPNRGDCASILGIARDLSAKFELPINSPGIDAIESVNKSSLSIKNSAPAQCPRYVGRVINNINLKAITPVWMQEDLRRSGLRLVNPVVDISNYVMLELGAPTHAFDLDKLDSGIEIRCAKDGEEITLLDGQTVKLKKNTVVIADATRAQAVAGVMGALHTSVDEHTKNVFLECAYFNPASVCQSARQINTISDSSYRFERGVDYKLQKLAIERFTQLLLEICGGEPGPVCEVVEKKFLPVQPLVTLRQNQIKRLLGIEIDDASVEAILTSLGMTVTKIDHGWEVLVPSYRFDITMEADLIEELVRLHGYKNLPATTLLGELKIPQESATKLPYLRVQNLLTDLGYSEAITYSFVDPHLQRHFDAEGEFLTLANPLSEEISVMRTSLWPGLVQALQYNLNRQVQRLRLFETGLCFVKEGKELKQHSRVAGLIAGQAHPPQWDKKDRMVDFFDLKGDIEQLFCETNQNKKLSWKKSNHPALHPGQSAELFLDEISVGNVGALHPKIVESLGLSVSPYVFELDMDKISTILPPKYDLISKFPAVRRDLAIVIDDNISAEAIEKNVRDFAGHLLLDFKIFDIYHGEGIELGKKSVALGLTFQEPSRTLIDEEVNDIVTRVVSGLEVKLKAILRA